MPLDPPRNARPLPDRPSGTVPAADAVPCYDSEQLFGGGRHVLIVHAGRQYSLRLTATNKLILTA